MYKRQGLGTWKPPRGYDEYPESSELVTVFLWENETESAWAQAKAGGCSPRLWMRLANLRQDEHPKDAIPIYQEEVERAIGARTVSYTHLDVYKRQARNGDQ